MAGEVNEDDIESRPDDDADVLEAGGSDDIDVVEEARPDSSVAGFAVSPRCSRIMSPSSSNLSLLNCLSLSWFRRRDRAAAKTRFRSLWSPDLSMYSGTRYRRHISRFSSSLIMFAFALHIRHVNTMSWEECVLIAKGKNCRYEYGTTLCLIRRSVSPHTTQIFFLTVLKYGSPILPMPLGWNVSWIVGDLGHNSSPSLSRSSSSFSSLTILASPFFK
mmetsp:Transcript_896/g.2023  ORF Transcript_896/g.2023 Transcript_896/m.2023 type:complete len:218 (+) Transcript_896:392-1045(+)